MRVEQFRYGGDNFSYVLFSDGAAVAVDPGAVTSVLSHLKSEGLELTGVMNTHNHPDHTIGVQEVLDATGARFFDNASLRQNKTAPVGGETVQVMHTPGHTHDSLCFYTPGFLISGDTLFNGTVGNCFSGDLEAFYKSIKAIMALPPETLVYAGHDYVREALAFARHVEPDNPHLEPFLKKYDPRHVFSTLEDEGRINPYLRFNAPEMIQALKERGLAVDTEYDRWRSVMHLG